jgi:hypothetical protein
MISTSGRKLLITGGARKRASEIIAQGFARRYWYHIKASTGRGHGCNPKKNTCLLMNIMVRCRKEHCRIACLYNIHSKCGKRLQLIYKRE